MTDREAKEIILSLLNEMDKEDAILIKTKSDKFTGALWQAVRALYERQQDTTEKPVRTGCDERKEGKWATISVEDVESLNRRFFDLEQAVEKLSVDLDILRDRFDSHIWERHDED